MAPGRLKAAVIFGSLALAGQCHAGKVAPAPHASMLCTAGASEFCHSGLSLMQPVLASPTLPKNSILVYSSHMVKIAGCAERSLQGCGNVNTETVPSILKRQAMRTKPLQELPLMPGWQ